MLAQLPEIVSGYELSPGEGWISVIRPKAATNLIPNPDFERGARGWVTSFGANPVQLDPVNTGGGAYSLMTRGAAGAGLRLETTLTDGFSSQPNIPLTAGKNYVLSFKYRTALATADTLVVTLYGSVSGVDNVFVGSYFVDGLPMPVMPQSSAWRRVVVVIRETVTQLRNVRIGTAGTANGDLWIDDVQLEEGTTPTTLISGDLSGAAIEAGDYQWVSVPGNSASLRSAACVAGGEVVNLAQFGLRVMAVIGLGLAGQNNIVQPSANGGGYYSETITRGTQFQIVGRLDGATPFELAQRRSALIAALRHDRAGGISRPVVLRYRLRNCRDLLTDYVDIPCVYAGGLEGQVDNLYSENVSIAFEHYNRDLIAERGAGSPLSNVESTTYTGGVLLNTATDAYTFLSIANVTTLNVVRPAGDGTFWIGGPFTNAGGVGTANAIAKWNPSANTIQGFGAATVSGVGVDGILVSPTGYVYAWGEFSQLGGVASGNVIRYDPTLQVWQQFGNTNGRVRAVVETTGRVYIFGDFTTVNGSARQAGAYTSDNGATWTAVTFPVGTVSSVRGAAWDRKTNRLYFSALTGVQSYAGYLDLTAGTSTAAIFGASLSVTYPGIFIMPAGDVVFVRSSTAGGTTSGIFRYGGGTQLISLAEYPAAFLNGVSRTWQDSVGNVYLVTPVQSLLGGILSPADFHIWDGQRVNPSPLFVGLNSYYPIGFADRFGPYQLTVLQTQVYVSTPGVTTIDNVGSNSPALLRFQGPGFLKALTNVTTGQSILFNMTLRAGEVLTIDTRTGRISSSETGTNVAGVLSQSTVSRWRLAPGSNRIRVQFWPRAQNASEEYNPVLSGTASNPGVAFLRNASFATTDGGKVYWDVDASDNGFLRVGYVSGKKVGSIPGGIIINATADLPIQLAGQVDLVPSPGPASGVFWYPLAHIYYDDLLSSIDGVTER